MVLKPVIYMVLAMCMDNEVCRKHGIELRELFAKCSECQAAPPETPSETSSETPSEARGHNASECGCRPDARRKRKNLSCTIDLDPNPYNSRYTNPGTALLQNHLRAAESHSPDSRALYAGLELPPI